MKRIIVSLFIGIVWPYTIGAFVGLEFNPLEWSEHGRVAFTAIITFVTTVAYTCPVWDP